MNSQQFVALCEEFDLEEKQLLGIKGGDYATHDDRLWNFKAQAALEGKLGSQVAMSHLLKHMVTIIKMVREESGNWVWEVNGQEGMKQRIADAVNYLHLLAANLEEERTSSDAGKLVV